ncbi:MAG: hypothetical protein VYC72_12085, partial [Verrucomicrobiota bacterium]|nr:hypothetical protein [Verrucomicrobiota bacterium]
SGARSSRDRDNPSHQTKSTRHLVFAGQMKPPKIKTLKTGKITLSSLYLLVCDFLQFKLH